MPNACEARQKIIQQKMARIGKYVNLFLLTDWLPKPRFIKQHASLQQPS
jgi:hypothetical protein